MKRVRSAAGNDRLLKRYQTALDNKDYYEALQLCRTLAGRMPNHEAALGLLLDAANTFAAVEGQEGAVADLVADYCALSKEELLANDTLDKLLALARRVTNPESRAQVLSTLMATFDKPYRTLPPAQVAAMSPPERTAYEQRRRTTCELADVMCDTQRQLEKYDLALHFGVRAVDVCSAGTDSARVARVAEIVFEWAQAGNFGVEWDFFLARTVLALMRSKLIEGVPHCIEDSLYTLAARLFRDEVNECAAAAQQQQQQATSDEQKKRRMTFEQSPLMHFVQGALLLSNARKHALDASNTAEAAAASNAYGELMRKYEQTLKRPDPELWKLAELVAESRFALDAPRLRALLSDPDHPAAAAAAAAFPPAQGMGPLMDLVRSFMRGASESQQPHGTQ